MKSPDQLIHEADQLRDRGMFVEAALAYKNAIIAAPDRPHLLVQLGNMLKDTGDVAGAIVAYREAISKRYDGSDTFLQLGRALKLQGERAASLRALGHALQLAPADNDIVREIVQLGKGWEAGRAHQLGDRLLTGVLQLADEIRQSLRKIDAQLPLISTLVRLPSDRHDSWRMTRKSLPPHQPALDLRLAVIVQGDAPLRSLLAVLASLRSQTHSRFSVVMPDLTGASRDAFQRLSNACPSRYISTCSHANKIAPLISMFDQHDAIVLMRAPMILDLEMLAWMAKRLDENYDCVIPDEDVVTFVGEFPTFSEPWLSSEIDLEWLEQGFDPGSVMAVKTAILTKAIDEVGDPPHPSHLALSIARSSKSIPLAEVFASRPSDVNCPSVVEQSMRHHTKNDAKLGIIIPTRDHAELLESCLSSLQKYSKNYGNLKIIIVDNGSTDPAAVRLLVDGERTGRFGCVVANEPFNWSRFNRLGVEAIDCENLVFMNNDVDIATWDWDELVAYHLSRPEIGVVGAKLMYNNGTFQHAGMYIQTPGHFEHIGRGEPSTTRGPKGIYQRRHCVTAVTGALLATRRDVFDRLGGFDDIGLPLWFNDVDYCLKSWQAGLRVIYEPGIEAWHRESISTSTSFNQSTHVAYMEDARRLLIDRWGNDLQKDRWYRF